MLFVKLYRERMLFDREERNKFYKLQTNSYQIEVKMSIGDSQSVQSSAFLLLLNLEQTMILL